ncbi:hypothetical protein [Luteolibacter flavescens]|uniref:hypothetical protein n=1 Tax=Luteolibacter flavescens TaxID=1859460 RepID=UPI002223A936|nr:hypothetical protein [Luteolibacter flavescens]
MDQLFTFVDPDRDKAVRVVGVSNGGAFQEINIIGSAAFEARVVELDAGMDQFAAFRLYLKHLGFGVVGEMASRADRGFPDLVGADIEFLTLAGGCCGEAGAAA